MKRVKKIWLENIWLKMSVFNGASVVSRVFSSLIINKLIAIYAGPQGTALSEQLRDFVRSMQGFSSLGINEGVTRYTAKYEDQSKPLSKFLGFSYQIVTLTSLLLSVFIIIFSGTINARLFAGHDFQNLIILSALILPLLAINLIILSVLNGFQEYKKVSYIGIIGNVISVILAIILLYNFRLFGALLLVLLAQFGTFIISLIIGRAQLRFLQFKHITLDKKQFIRLLPYILMGLVTAIVVPLLNMGIRDLIFSHYTGDKGLHAGYWDAVRKISGLFLAFVTPLFGLYYLPTLSKIQTNLEFKTEVKKFFTQFFPWFSIGLFLLYLLRHWVTYIVFSESYYPMESLFAWQFTGDLLRIVSLSISYLMLARAHYIKYIITEIGFGLFFYASTQYFIRQYELQGVVMAYAATYFIYLLALIVLYHKILFSRRSIDL